MARRPKFGRGPRIQAGIGGTLVAIAREMQNREDSNIMDAWKNGGEFRGKKVTDEMVMSYWNKRDDGLDKADPAYDTVRDQIMQLQYGIEQSKQDLAHVQNKISDTQYAQFFLKWSNKAPKHGEFWRALQKDAAQLLESAKEKARVNGDKMKLEAFNKFVGGRQGDIDLGNALTDAINQIAKESGMSITGNGDAILRMLSEDYKAHPDKYHRLADSIKAGGQDFNGTFSHGWVATQVGNSEQAYDQVATRAKRDGYADAYNSATNGQATMAGAATDMGTWSVAKAYDRIYAAMARVTDDPTASLQDKMIAGQVASAAITKLAGQPGLGAGTVKMLSGDAARLVGQDGGDAMSFGAVLGHPQIDAKVQNTMATIRASEDMMAQNPGQYVRAPLKTDGTFDPTGQGPVGIVAASSIPSDVKFVAVPGLSGQPAMVAVQPKSVFVADPNDPHAPPVEVGKVLSYGVGGHTVTMYGYQDGTGQSHWTLRSPYADGTGMETDKDGNVTLHLASQVDPVAKATQIEQEYHMEPGSLSKLVSAAGGGSASTSTYEYDPATKKQSSRVTISFKDGKFEIAKTAQVYDPTTKKMTDGATVTVPVVYSTGGQLAQRALAPSMWAGGDVPGTFPSAVSASVAATSSTMAAGQIAALAKDPNFQHAFVVQTMANFGTSNPLDPRVTSAWDSVTSQAAFAAAVPGIGLGNRLPNGKAIDRKDLNLPGLGEDPTRSDISITFNGQNISLPKAPAFLNQADPNAVGANAVGPWATSAGGFSGQVLQPGQMPGGQAPAGGGATVNAATGFTITPPTPTTTGTPPAGAGTPNVSGATGLNTGLPTSTGAGAGNHANKAL